ncbi:MAG: sialate O-acetylesterase [Akkermansiaceae bacterium]|nr:sialate O-acetylesterase [Akkermansiaceae bacterium]NNM30070.1 sialate O-acetylesterase [Akkermansiaceae bacterium]
MSKPVQVFILMGQSNMLEMGKVKGGDGSLEHAVKEKGLYPYLVDEGGNWTERKDVRYVRVMGSGGPGKTRQFNNEWMTVSGGKIGVEIGIGHQVGHAIEAPVMVLKSAIGNRGLGWDLLPPGSESFEFTDSKGVTWVHPGYKGSPERWKKGEEPKPIGWYAGLQYDGDVDRAKKVLAELDKYYPGAKGYEVAGFFWWQGDRDSRSEALSSRYEKNLVQLIKQLRKDFDAPNAKFVTASLGQTKKGATDGGGKILDAMLAVDGESGKYPEFKGNVAAVYTHPLSKGGSSGGHYSGNAETYMNVGEAMGAAMVKLLDGK